MCNVLMSQVKEVVNPLYLKALDSLLEQESVCACAHWFVLLRNHTAMLNGSQHLTVNTRYTWLIACLILLWSVYIQLVSNEVGVGPGISDDALSFSCLRMHDGDRFSFLSFAVGNIALYLASAVNSKIVMGVDNT